MNGMKEKKVNNKGFSLVELIVGIAILAVVSGIILTFMNTSSNVFRRNSADVDIQTEAQMVANSISDLVIDCGTVKESSFSLSGMPGVTGSKTYDATNSFEVLNTEERYFIFHDDSTDKIFYVETKYDYTTKSWPPYNGTNAQLLAQNVTNFDFDISQINTKKRLFTFNLDYTLGPKTFSGNYKVHLRNSLRKDANFDVPPEEGTISTVSVSPNPYVTWYHKPVGAQFFAKVRGSSIFVDTGVAWKIEETGSGFSIDADTGDMKVGPSGSTGITIKKFKVVATSTKDNSKSGYAEVLIKRIMNVGVIPTGGIVGEHETNKLPATVQMGTVTCAAQVEGWNLVTEDSSVTWKLQYKTNLASNYQDLAYIDTATKSYKNLNPDIASLIPSKRTCSIKLGKSAGSGVVFRIIATSVVEDTKMGSYEFSVIKTATKFNDKMVRGAYINLNDYFLVNGAEGRQILSISKITIQAVTNLDASMFSTIYLKDGVMFIDYDVGRYTKEQYWLILRKGFDEMTFLIDGIDQNGQAFTGQLGKIRPFPGVQLVKSSADDNIVLTKGSSIDLPIEFKGYNFTDLNQLSLLADIDDLNAPGNANVNRYVAAKITTGVGNAHDPITNATIKVSAKTSDTRYPENGIPFKIAFRDYYPYPATSVTEGWHLPYTVYVANVIGKQVFVPGPESTSWASGVGTSYKTYTNYGPNKLSVQLLYATVGADRVYYMKYDGTEYLYNSGLNCWQVK